MLARAWDLKCRIRFSQVGDATADRQLWRKRLVFSERDVYFVVAGACCLYWLTFVKRVGTTRGSMVDQNFAVGRNEITGIRAHSYARSEAIRLAHLVLKDCGMIG
jgi:hypothetical protein